MKRRNRKLTDRRQKKIIYIAAGCIAICLIAASVLFYMGRISGSSGAGREGGGDRKEASEKSEKTETEDNGSSAGELEIPETEIEQSSDSAGDDAPITVNTDGTVDVSKIEGYASAQEETEFSKVGQTNGDKSGFFPFNDTNGASTYSDDLNYWFGMSMSVDFYMLNGGYMDTAHTEPITFDFSGDDDVWIYIDGKLVLDMGGIHDMATGSINFGTGWITLTPADGETERTKLSSILGEGWVNDNGIHSPQIFYMERGEGASNLKVKFNLPQKDQLIVEKQFDNTSASESEREELLKENFTFQLKRGDTEGNLQNYAEAVYALFENGAMIGRNLTTDSEGKFTLKYNQRAVFSLEMPRPDSHYYQVSEIEPGQEYTAAWDTSTNNAQTGSGEGTGRSRPSSERRRSICAQM